MKIRKVLIYRPELPISNKVNLNLLEESIFEYICYSHMLNHGNIIAIEVDKTLYYIDKDGWIYIRLGKLFNCHKSIVKKIEGMLSDQFPEFKLIREDRR